MPKPLAICIEDLDPSGVGYTQCVALVGRQPGLRLDSTGHVTWLEDDDVACELWVSADDRLMLYRSAAATSVVLHRVERSLDVPHGKPVIVIDQDEVVVGSRRLRIHIHGEAPVVAAPLPLPASRPPLKRLARGLTTAAAVGAAVAAVACGPIEVRETPPVIRESEPPTETGMTAAHANHQLGDLVRRLVRENNALPRHIRRDPTRARVFEAFDGKISWWQRYAGKTMPATRAGWQALRVSDRAQANAAAASDLLDGPSRQARERYDQSVRRLNRAIRYWTYYKQAGEGPAAQIRSTR
jgi:hypothetical protein